MEIHKKTHRRKKSYKEQLGNWMFPSLYRREQRSFTLQRIKNHWYKMNDFRRAEFSVPSFST
jgi:hypothetical protein